MFKTVGKITIVLLVIIALPVSFYITRELASLNEGERVVKRAFDAQLESLLFSVNQDTDNMLGNWASSLSLPVSYNGEIMQRIALKTIHNNPAIINVCYWDIDNKSLLVNYSVSDIGRKCVYLPSDTLISMLKGYIDSDYRKIYPTINDSILSFHFLVESMDNHVLCVINTLKNEFIDQNLGLIFQNISQKRFALSAYDQLNEKIVYATDPGIDTVGIHSIESWYLPDHLYQIKLKEKTIDQLVSERSRKDDIVLYSVLLIVVIGALFVLLNIRKEVRLASMKSEFVSNVSHEIRTPLALISMYTETLMLGRLKNEERKQKYLNVIHEETQRLSAMVSRILSFSRIEKGKRIYNKEALDICEQVNELYNNYEAHFRSKGALSQIILPDCPLWIYADKEALQESLVNLIDNAIKYGKDEEKQVIIEVKSRNKQVVLNVTDNGIGIEQKDIKNIFNKFYRVTTGDLAHKAKGTGLGLNIVWQIMKEHDGKVTVKSKPEKGSTFTLFFPEHKPEK